MNDHYEDVISLKLHKLNSYSSTCTEYLTLKNEENKNQSLQQNK